jgi:purine-binding chemotaxis protein CheW
MEEASSNEQDVVPALLFRVRSRLCALPITHVVETMRPLPIEPLANMPIAVKGMAMIRGVPMPVVALSALLDDDHAVSGRFVTVRAGKDQIALTVDSVLGVRQIALTSLQELPPLLRDADNDAVSAIGAVDAELLLILNATRLVPDGMWDALNTAGETQS